MAFANSADKIRLFLKEQFDQGLHSLPFYEVFQKQYHKNLVQKKYGTQQLKILGHLPYLESR